MVSSRNFFDSQNLFGWKFTSYYLQWQGKYIENAWKCNLKKIVNVTNIFQVFYIEPIFSSHAKLFSNVSKLKFRTWEKWPNWVEVNYLRISWARSCVLSIVFGMRKCNRKLAVSAEISIMILNYQRYFFEFNTSRVNSHQLQIHLIIRLIKVIFYFKIINVNADCKT